MHATSQELACPNERSSAITKQKMADWLADLFRSKIKGKVIFQNHVRCKSDAYTSFRNETSKVSFKGKL